jgi:hypothetical protein
VQSAADHGTRCNPGAICFARNRAPWFRWGGYVRNLGRNSHPACARYLREIPGIRGAVVAARLFCGVRGGRQPRLPERLLLGVNQARGSTKASARRRRKAKARKRGGATALANGQRADLIDALQNAVGHSRRRDRVGAAPWFSTFLEKALVSRVKRRKGSRLIKWPSRSVFIRMAEGSAATSTDCSRWEWSRLVHDDPV